MKMNPPPEKDPTPPPEKDPTRPPEKDPTQLPLGELQVVSSDGINTIPMDEPIVAPPKGTDTSPLGKKEEAIPTDATTQQFDETLLEFHKESYTPASVACNKEKPMAPPPIYLPPNLNGISPSVTLEGVPNMNFSPSNCLNKDFGSTYKPTGMLAYQKKEEDGFGGTHDSPRPNCEDIPPDITCALGAVSAYSDSSGRSNSFEIIAEPNNVQAPTDGGPSYCDLKDALALWELNKMKNNPEPPPLEKESVIPPSVYHSPLHDSLLATREGVPNTTFSTVVLEKKDSLASNQNPTGIFEYTSKEVDGFAGTHDSPKPKCRSSCENIPSYITYKCEAVSTHLESSGCESFEDIAKHDEMQAITGSANCDRLQALPEEEESAVPPSGYHPPVNDDLSVTKGGVPTTALSAELQKELDSGYGPSKKSTGAFESTESEKDALTSRSLLKPGQDMDTDYDKIHTVPCSTTVASTGIYDAVVTPSSEQLIRSTIQVESNREGLITGNEIPSDDCAHSDSEGDSIEIISERPNMDHENIENLGQFSRRITTNSQNYEMYATGGKNIKIVFKKGSIVKAFFDVYSKDISWQLDLEYGFQEEQGEGYGPTKEAFTRFHEEGKDSIYDGYGEKIPRECEKSKVLAQILYHQFKLTKRFPVLLCRALISEMLTGIDIRKYDQDCLLKSYCNTKIIKNKIIFISAINNGLENMSQKDKETFFGGIREELTAANKEHEGINDENWRQIFLDLSHLVLNENQSTVVHEFQECMRKDECDFYSVNEANQIINELNPTAKAIIDKFEIPSNLSEKQRKVLGFLFQFISSYCETSENAERLMLYCTSSTTLPFEPIQIAFNSVNGLMRAVRASTCDNLLHIPSTYEDQGEFEEEFMNTLQSDESFIFSFN